MIVHAIVDGRTTYEVELDENSGRYYLVEKIGMKRQTGRILLKSWGYVAACGEAAPAPTPGPVSDAVPIAAETTSTTTPPLHAIDTTARNPFDRP